MLLRALTYRHDTLDVVVEMALAGGQNGAVRVDNRVRAFGPQLTDEQMKRDTTMIQQELEIINKLGLHARASAKLTQLAAKSRATSG